MIECAGETEHEIAYFLSSNISFAKSLLLKTIHLQAKEFHKNAND